MSRVLVLPASAWTPQPGGGHAARVAAPATGRLAIWAEAGEARLSSPTLSFQSLGRIAFAAGPAAAGETFRLHAPAPPQHCIVLGLPTPRHSPTLDAFLPRAVARPVQEPAPDLDATRARMDTALADGDLDAALAAVAELLILARDAPATLDAVAALLAHLARHPLCRSAALGALVAALTE